MGPLHSPSHDYSHFCHFVSQLPVHFGPLRVLVAQGQPIGSRKGSVDLQVLAVAEGGNGRRGVGGEVGWVELPCSSSFCPDHKAASNTAGFEADYGTLVVGASPLPIC